MLDKELLEKLLDAQLLTEDTALLAENALLLDGDLPNAELLEELLDAKLLLEKLLDAELLNITEVLDRSELLTEDKELLAERE